MNKRSRWYRHPRTTVELRTNQDCKFARARRKKRYLPNTYDDLHVHHQKTWKVNRKKQYRIGGRGKRNQLAFKGKDWSTEWNFQEYCKEHDIPHTIEYKIESYFYEYYPRKWVVTGTTPRYILRYDGNKFVFVKDLTHQIGWEETGKWVYDSVPKLCKTHKIIYTKLVWWSNKDIGIQYIVNTNNLTIINDSISTK